jgi:hypothetical protein
MARFSINFRNGTRSLGTPRAQLPSLNAAKELAMKSARELVAENVKAASKNPVEAVIITDETGGELMTIPATDVLPEPLKK